MIYFLIPTYNESANIENLLNEINSLEINPSFKLIITDDGSTDNTLELINKHDCKFPIQILTGEKNAGPGIALNRGLEWILNDSTSSKDAIITMEADTTSDITLVPKMLTLHQLGFDLVLASVYAQSGGFEGTTFTRKFISSVANITFRILYDIKVLTISSFFRLYDINLLIKIKQSNNIIISEKGFTCMLEILIKAIHQKASVIEIPMTLSSKKRHDKSKMKLFKTTKEYIRFYFKFRMSKNKHESK